MYEAEDLIVAIAYRFLIFFLVSNFVLQGYLTRLMTIAPSDDRVYKLNKHHQFERHLAAKWRKARR